ncbi:MAG TPA: AmmeMemoRadiSam system protein B [Bacteroidales bacterium]|nr:AmmeMemoRadiSam system protein B [Bacteroidales bacterium]
MMNLTGKFIAFRLTLLILMVICTSPVMSQGKSSAIRLRQPVDTVGFASHALQMDSVMSRITRLNKHVQDISNSYAIAGSRNFQKAAICPHDDYVYAGWLYPEVLKNIHANTIIVFGVAHKAKKFNVENRLVFDSFDEWKEPYGNVTISDLREEIMKTLPSESYLVHDSLQQAEHSVEAIIPFLQYYNRKIRIISILVPYMPYEKMNQLSEQLATGIGKVLKAKGLKWGRDVAFVMSTDAVHYGDEDWGGSNYAFYGCDDKGFNAAKAHEMEIINGSLTGTMDPEKARKFTQFTLREEDYKAYKWTWCGRYSVPFGLLTIMKMQAAASGKLLQGIFIGYGTSLDEPRLKVSDLGMGTTANATMHHWVGYAGISYY